MPFIEFGGLKGKFFKRNVYIQLDTNTTDKKVEELKDEYHNQDIYFSIYRYETENVAECGICAPLYLDFDSDIETDNDYARLKRQVVQTINYFEKGFGIPSSMQKIYFSGHKGFHLLIPDECFGIDYCQDLNERYKLIAKMVDADNACPSLDMKIYDRRRLFRIPNSINSKSGLYKVPVTKQQLRQFSYEEMKEWASEPREVETDEPEPIERAIAIFEKCFQETPEDKVRERRKAREKERKAKRSVPVDKDGKPKHYKLSPCIINILEAGAVEGQRNNTAIALASSLFQNGRTREEVDAIMAEWNEINEPPIDDMELYTTINSAQGMFDNGRTYGYTKLHELGYCLGKKCKHYKSCTGKR